MPFIKVNCATLTPDLLVSELFGYVKGAFTGAAETRTGLIAAANRHSLFSMKSNSSFNSKKLPHKSLQRFTVKNHQKPEFHHPNSRSFSRSGKKTGQLE